MVVIGTFLLKKKLGDPNSFETCRKGTQTTAITPVLHCYRVAMHGSETIEYVFGHHAVSDRARLKLQVFLPPQLSFPFFLFQL